MNILKKFKILWNMRWVFRSLHKTIYFIFKYLKLKDAIKLPILLYKPHLIAMKGTIIFDCPVKFGLVTLGTFASNMHPNSGIAWENNGGEVVFKGKCKIGNATHISIGAKGLLTIGDDLVNASGLRICCFRKVTICDHVRLGWGVTLMDTNFHPLIEKSTNKIKKASGDIFIGSFNWIGMECVVMHSVSTPERCIIGARTIVTRGADLESYCVTVFPNKGKIVSRDVYGDITGPNNMDPTI